jgi:hypothetical protein
LKQTRTGLETKKGSNPVHPIISKHW